jgi:signal transduction histidine kinase
MQPEEHQLVGERPVPDRWIDSTSNSSAARTRLRPEQELLIFRVIQELVNNILKHSNASFIHITQNYNDDKFYIRIHHDGRGITQSDFDKLNKSAMGLGLKNIQSRIRVLQGNINFEKDMSQTYFKVTLEIPVDVEAVA